MAERLLVAALPLTQVRETAVRVGLAREVVELAVQGEGVPEVCVGVGEAVEPDVGAGEPPVGECLSGPVSRPPRGVQCGALGAYPVVPVPPPVEEVPQCPGKLPGVAVEPRGGRLV